MKWPEPSPGQIYFVGAGPGDPGLITLKGAHYLQGADVVLYDDLLDQRLLGLAPSTCQKIYVGKRGGRQSPSQEEINQLLIQHALRDRVVVRLKGGDPFVFGRGGEEAMALKDEGLAFEIVSGVTAATGVPAYAGIPLTHRGIAAAAVLVTAQEDPTRNTPNIDWEKLAQMDCTLVIFMGSRKLAQLSATLKDHGRAADTPVALIEWGTWPHQRTVVTTLEHTADAAAREDIQSPTLIVVGEVVHLRQQLNWFEKKPLFGRRVLITRSREQAGDLQVLLEAQGAQVVPLPQLQLKAPEDSTELDRSIAELASFKWVVFTSPNSVDFFFSRLRHLGRDARAFGSAAVAALGLATAAGLRSRGLYPDLIPSEQSQEGLVKAFAELPVENSKILLPTSSIGRALLAAHLEKRGAIVHRITAYQNLPPTPEEIKLPPALTENRLDLAIFASPSSVDHFRALLGPESTQKILADTIIACIGPTTAQAIQALGLQTHIQPQDSSIPALIRAICAYFGEQKP